MLKAALTGALALAAVGILPASAAEKATKSAAAASYVDPAVEAKIAWAKAVLRLRPDQERYWPRVAAAIRDWANEPPASASNFIEHAKSRAVHAKRVVSAALPLMRALDPDQKQTAMMLIRAMGFGHLAAAL